MAGLCKRPTTDKTTGTRIIHDVTPHPHLMPYGRQAEPSQGTPVQLPIDHSSGVCQRGHFRGHLSIDPYNLSLKSIAYCSNYKAPGSTKCTKKGVHGRPFLCLKFANYGDSSCHRYRRSLRSGPDGMSHSAAQAATGTCGDAVEVSLRKVDHRPIETAQPVLGAPTLQFSIIGTPNLWCLPHTCPNRWPLRSIQSAASPVRVIGGRQQEKR